MYIELALDLSVSCFSRMLHTHERERAFVHKKVASNIKGRILSRGRLATPRLCLKFGKSALESFLAKCGEADLRWMRSSLRAAQFGALSASASAARVDLGAREK